MTRSALLSLLLLAACGVAGTPVAPAVDVVPGVTFGGSVKAGIAKDGGI